VICSSGIGFDPMVGGTRLTFGFEGIWQGTAVLYDHQTGSLWMHLTGECFQGEHAGTVLARLDSGRHTTWADWRRAHPATDVLRPDPRLRDRYFDAASARSGSPRLPPEFPGTIRDRDPRLAPNDLLYGVVVGETARGYPFARLAAAPVVEERVGDVEATVWFDAASRSAAAFDRRLGERLLSFSFSEPGRLRDAGTGSTWDMEGRCTAGALAGSALRPLRGLTTEWYGWYAAYPRTTLWP
jgi:hypothetical protein